MSTLRTLPAELSIYTVGELKAVCLGWMGESGHDADPQGGHWPLDASAVDQVDAAGLQLLVSLSKSLSQQQLNLQLQQPSAPLTAACAALGLHAWLAACTSEGTPS